MSQLDHVVHQKTKTVRGFIFSSPESLEPSIAIEKGRDFMTSTSVALKYGAIDPFKMHVVFVRAAAYHLAILLSGKISLKRGLRWSATARGTLCCTSKLVTLTSALVIYTCNCKV